MRISLRKVNEEIKSLFKNWTVPETPRWANTKEWSIYAVLDSPKQKKIDKNSSKVTQEYKRAIENLKEAIDDQKEQLKKLDEEIKYN